MNDSLPKLELRSIRQKSAGTQSLQKIVPKQDYINSKVINKFTELRGSKNNQAQQNHIYTSAQSLQNDYIYKHMTLDIGSLPSFLYDSSSEPLFNYKSKGKNIKKNEDFEDDKNTYLKKNLDNRTPLEILKSENNEKRRAQAAKDLVNQIFKKHFGDEADKFEEKNEEELYKLKNAYVYQTEKLDSPILKTMKKHKKEHLDRKFDILDKLFDERKKTQEEKLKNIADFGVGSSHNIMQSQHHLQQGKGYIESKKSQVYGKDFKPIQSKTTQYSPVQVHQKDMISHDSPQKSDQFNAYNSHKIDLISTMKHTHVAMNAQQREEKFINLTFRHQDLHTSYKEYKQQKLQEIVQNQIEQRMKQKESQIRKLKKYDNYVMRRRQNLSPQDPDFEEVRREFLEKNEMPAHQIILWENDQIIIWNDNLLGCNIIYHMILTFPTWNCLRRLEVVNSDLKDGTLFILTEFIIQECVNLHYLDLSMNKMGLRTAQSLQKGIMNIPLISLKLKGMDITTKLFCILALGIAKSNSIQEINLADNLLDNRAIKTLETLIRYIKVIQRIDIQQNKDISDEVKKNFRKMVNQNAQLKHKEIRIQ